eukprot:scaffold578_cov167-Amphora_coffeaeformis.AAC.40
MMTSTKLFLAVSALPVNLAFQASLPILTPPTLLHSPLLQAPDNQEALSYLLRTRNGIIPATSLAYQQHAHLWIADGSAFDTIRNIAAGVTAVLFLLVGLTYAYASFIIPAAAKELEKECKELDPQLWEQYQAKLGEGEVMASRPDLMQELGTKLQPLLEAKLRALDEAGLPTPLETTLNPFSKDRASTKKSESDPSSIPTSSNQWDDDGVIDAVFEKKTDDGEKK